MTIVCLNNKGGAGKTTISQIVAQHPKIEAKIVTNDAYHSLVDVYPDDIYFISDLNEVINDIEEEEGNLVFDLGGFVDTSVFKLLEKADVVIIPIKSDVGTIHGTEKTFFEVQEYVNPESIIFVDNMREDNSEIPEFVKTVFGEEFPVLPLRKNKLLDNAQRDAVNYLDYVYKAKQRKFRENSYKGVLADISEIINEVIEKGKNDG